MTSRDPLSEFALDNDAEIAEMQRRWENGHLPHYVTVLLPFVERHRTDILCIAGGASDPGALLSGTKRLIMRWRVVHLCSEMKDQWHEMRNEIWIQGERGDYDVARIMHDWIAQHAANWRRWRVKEYLFVADRCASDIVALLLA